MVEPLFKYELPLAVGQTVALQGEEGHHAASVRRMRVGEAIALTDGHSTHARGVVASVAAKSLEVNIESLSTLATPSPRFSLVQALAKGDRDELAVQAATELGVYGVMPWQSERSVSKWEGPKVAKSVARWQSISEEASKQSLRPLFAQVHNPVSSKELAKLISESEAEWLILDPTASQSIASVESSQKSEYFLVVGAEGGITDHELQMFESAGAKRVHLGSGILRTSTAGMAALAFLAGKFGLWG
jgi:16S rRNA (uracil1498-N3)-methyltransferase